MSNPQFNVIVDGTVLAGFDPGAVLLHLQQQLKLPAAKAQLLIAGKTVTVKRDVDESVANTYCQRLLALGVAARTEAVAVVSAATADASMPKNTTKPLAAPGSYERKRRYFPDTPLASDDIACSSAFNKAILGANLSCLQAVSAYLALALFATGFFAFYLAHYAYLLTAPPILFSAAVYLLPLFVLAVLLIILLRPLLPRESEPDLSHQLSPIQQPALFAFVTQLCDALALKAPEQIQLTAAAENAATPLPGLKSLMRGEYALALSLPQIENFRFDQFAASLAGDLATQARLPALRYHALAKFAGLQLDACLRNRDWLSRKLDTLSLSAPAKLGKTVDIGKKLCGQANLYLQKIVARLQRIEAKLQRHLVIEHDRYCALLGGSEYFFELLVARARLDAAARDANAKNLEDRIEGGLVDDLPALIRHYFDGVDENFVAALKRKWETETTPRRDEPPIARERIEQVLGASKPAIVENKEPAAMLVQERDELARQVTRDSYRSAQLNFDPERLLPVDELTYAATQDILQRQQAAIYFNDWFKPFRFWSLADYALIRDMPLQDAAAQLSVCVNEIRRLTPDRAKLLAEFDRLQNQLREIVLAQHVLAVGKKFAFRYVAYDGTTLVPLLEERQQQIAKVVEKLAQQEAVMGGRITLGLRLSGQADRDIQSLHDALRLLHDIGTRLQKIALDIFQLEQLLQRQYDLREADYSLPIKRLETKIQDACGLLIVRLNDIPYPLDARHRSLKTFVESVLDQPATKARSPILQRAQRLLDVLYRVNEKLSLQAADYGTIAEEAYRIEPIKLINATV